MSEFVQVSAAGSKSVGYLMHDGAVVSFTEKQARESLDMYGKLFGNQSGIVQTVGELQDIVLKYQCRIDCCYFVPIGILREIGGFEEDVEFVASEA